MQAPEFFFGILIFGTKHGVGMREKYYCWLPAEQSACLSWIEQMTSILKVGDYKVLPLSWNVGYFGFLQTDYRGKEKTHTPLIITLFN